MATADETFDFVIVGSGGGSMCAALVLHKAGLRALILEKTALIGGTTAKSGGRQEFTLNLDTAFFGSRAVYEHFRAQGSGAIVNTSSVAGTDGVQGLAAYSSAKCALQMFTRVAAAEWGPHGIRVNAVSPGLIATENAMKDFAAANLDVDGVCRSRPLRRSGRPEEVAKAIVFLASDAASYITGETIQVNGGPVVGGTAD